jgi:hypothetical protein
LKDAGEAVGGALGAAAVENAFVKVTTAGKGDAVGDKCVWELKSATEIFPVE